MSRSVALLVTCALVIPALAQKLPVQRADQLPRFTYTLDGNVEELLTADEKFLKLASAVRRDVEHVLRDYEIADRAKVRELLEILANVSFSTHDDTRAMEYLS